MTRLAREALAATLLLTLAAAAPALASEVRFFRLQSTEAFRAGTLEGIAIDRLGVLSLSDRFERTGEIGEPFLFAAAEHPEGWVFGTGNAGKVLLATREGEIRTLFEASEPEIFAVWADDDGTVFAGSSPQGKVYRIAGGRSEVFFEPGEVYIWDIVRGTGGELLVATGTEGRLYRVAADGTGDVLFDSSDTHVRVLEPLPGGGVLAGTAGDGLILSISAAGEARTLYDAAQPEVVALARDADGYSYAAVLASEASLVDLARRAGSAAGQTEAGAGGGQPAIQVTVQAGAQAGSGFSGSRPESFEGPRSEILRLGADGQVETIWRFDDQTVYGLLHDAGRLWIGTGLDGELYSLSERSLVLEQDVDERQVVAVLADREGPAFATANAAALYRRAGGRGRRGVYTSPALDAGQIADFGALDWEGALPAGAEIRFAFRSGMSADPDATWSAWTAPAGGREVALAGVPAGRYLQWRAELASAEGSPRLARVTISYRQVNLPPRIESFEAMDPGEILVPANFNPSNQAYEPAHPNRDGIFTTLSTRGEGGEGGRKTLWKRGYQTLRWSAEDPNDDELEYELRFRREGVDEEWLPVVDGLDEEFYSFDGTSLPDGTYRFLLRAADRPRAQAGEGLVEEAISEAVVLDHTPPRLAGLERGEGAVEATVVDAASPLREAVVSVDAGPWRPARAVDGLLDERRERLRVELPAGARMVLLRVTDAAFNVASFDLLAEAPR